MMSPTIKSGPSPTSPAPKGQTNRAKRTAKRRPGSPRQSGIKRAFDPDPKITRPKRTPPASPTSPAPKGQTNVAKGRAKRRPGSPRQSGIKRAFDPNPKIIRPKRGLPASPPDQRASGEFFDHRPAFLAPDSPRLRPGRRSFLPLPFATIDRPLGAGNPHRQELETKAPF